MTIFDFEEKYKSLNLIGKFVFEHKLLSFIDLLENPPETDFEDFILNLFSSHKDNQISLMALLKAIKHVAPKYYSQYEFLFLIL